ncbi:hypothetical protein EG329_012851 [Mollisiaceae sp. DMI_Dod_QoI]|nr:hypothetical protein EG329_012851 [Helotiales sp. DMI_Dod_QoI]
MDKRDTKKKSVKSKNKKFLKGDASIPPPPQARSINVGPLEAFPIFKQLPNELQTMVWTAFIGEPGIRQYYIWMKDIKEENGTKTLCYLQPTTRKALDVSRACAESRKQVLAKLPNRLPGKEETEVWRFGEDDTICVLNGDLLMIAYDKMSENYDGFTIWPWARNVHYLMLPSGLIPWWMNGDATEMQNSNLLAEFSNLKELHFAMSHAGLQDLRPFKEHNMRQLAKTMTDDNRVFEIDHDAIERCIAESGGKTTECQRLVMKVVKQIEDGVAVIPVFTLYKALPLKIFALKGWTADLGLYNHYGGMG